MLLVSKIVCITLWGWLYKFMILWRVISAKIRIFECYSVLVELYYFVLDGTTLNWRACMLVLYWMVLL